MNLNGNKKGCDTFVVRLITSERYPARTRMNNDRYDAVRCIA